MPIEVVDIEIENLKARYNAAMHAIQSGIKVLIDSGETLATPKHLRVGIDSAHVTDLAFSRLLIAKGIITEHEYIEAVTVAAEEEKRALEKRLSDKFGKQITLG